jgi:hypothetical protein
MTYKDIANLIPTIQSAQLVNENIKSLKGKKKTTKDMLDMGMKNIVGTEMIKVNSQLIGSL